MPHLATRADPTLGVLEQSTIVRNGGTTGKQGNPTGQINGWKSILNTLAIAYLDRLDIN